MSKDLKPASRVMSISEGFFLEAAIGVLTTSELCLKYNVPEEEIQYLEEEPAFTMRLHDAEARVAADGSAFKERSRAIASGEGITQMQAILRDPDATPNLKHEVFKTLAAFGGFSAKSESAQSAATFTFEFQGGTNPGTSVTVTTEPVLSEHKEADCIDVTPEPVEEDVVENENITGLFSAS